MVVTDDALAEQIKTLIEPLAITCPEDFSRPDQLSSDTLLNTVLFSYILHSNPEEREYTDAHVCIPEKDADRQCQLLFGDAVSLNPMNYVQSSGQERIFYDAEEECYKMPSAGYYYDLPRVDKVEETEDGYLATVSFVAYTPGEEPGRRFGGSSSHPHRNIRFGKGSKQLDNPRVGKSIGPCFSRYMSYMRCIVLAGPLSLKGVFCEKYYDCGPIKGR